MNAHAGQTAPRGSLGLVVIRKDSWIPEEVRQFKPRSELGKFIKTVVLQHLPIDAMVELVERMTRTVAIETALGLRRFRGARWDGLRWRTEDAQLVEDLGIVGRRVVTNNGGGYIVDAFQNLVELETMKFHGLGTGVTAEAVGDSALVTELTTQYAPDNTRATGTNGEASQLVFTSVGTNTIDVVGPTAVTEHGLLSQAATGGGVLFDRTVFAAVNLGNGDSLQSTYSLTITAGL